MARDYYNPSKVNNHPRPAPVTRNSGRSPVALPLASIMPSGSDRPRRHRGKPFGGHRG